MVLVKGQLESPEEFGAIVLRANPNGSVVRLRDVARIEIGGLSYSYTTRLNGRPAAAVAVQLAPTGNALATAEAVKRKMAELAAFFPPGVKYEVSYDVTPVIAASVKKVLLTLAEAVVLVFVVIFLFLQNVRYTLIPTIVVPIALLGTCGALLALGFSINVLTMFAMVLAIGILVDDAIVVVENVERIMVEEGLSPREATVKAMGQITGAVIGITLVLTAVFVPMAFLARLGRHHVSPVLRGDGGLDRLLRLPRAVAHAGAVRDASQAGRARPRPCRRRLLRLVQPRARPDDAALRRRDAMDDRPLRPFHADLRGPRRRARLRAVAPAVRASCRSTTRDSSWSTCSHRPMRASTARSTW